jgi:hypothetical protein
MMMMMMNATTTPLLKVELVHKESLCGFLEQLCLRDTSFGFTTLDVQAGSGPSEGAYSPDVTDSQYYSFVLLPEDRLPWLLKVLKKHLAHEKCLIFTTPVTRIDFETPLI